MAEIDFSAGYRDATKGSTLKALQLRRAQMQTQIEQAMKPEPIASAWQGAAHVGGVIGSSIREARVANQEASGRERFAKLLAGGLTPDEIGEAMNLDPETTMKFQEHEWDSQAKKDERATEEMRLLRERGWSVEDAARRVRETIGTENRAAGRETAIDTREQGQTLDAEKRAAGRETAIDTRELDQTKDKEIRDAEAAKTVADEAARRASELSTQQAAQGDEMAQISLAEKAGYITPEVAQQRRDALNAEAAKKTIPAGLDQLNRDTAKEALEWKTTGAGTSASNLANIDEAIKTLGTPGIMGDVGDTIGLGKTGAVAGMLPPALGSVLNPSGEKAAAAVQTAVQSSLKLILGSQFAQNEGEQLLKRAFDKSMPPSENVRRMNMIKAQLQQAAEAKEQFVKYYFDHNYNMDGYEGPNLEQIKQDFNARVNAGLNASEGAAAPDAAAPDVSTMSDEDLRRIAGGTP
jgi:hypothetical protein